MDIPQNSHLDPNESGGRRVSVGKSCDGCTVSQRFAFRAQRAKLTAEVVIKDAPGKDRVYRFRQGNAWGDCFLRALFVSSAAA